MRISVIYDFGVNKGGGDFVMLNILEALNSAGYNITLMTSKPQGLCEANKLFYKKVNDVNVDNTKAPRFLHHPYTIAYVARRVAKKDNYDLFILSDDVPKYLSDKKVVCYVHYPHAARFRFREYVARKYMETLMGRIAWWAHKRLFPKFYPTRSIPNNWLFIANSAVTMEHTLRTFNLDPERITLLHPPVSSASINKLWRDNGVQKDDLVICIGRLEPNKRFDDVIHALSLLGDKSKLKLILIGFTYNQAYLERLVETIKNLNLEGRVELLLNAEREVVFDRLLRAKAVVLPTPHEPFGIAVVEGMAAGCIPIVRRGFNGPWMEITQEGKYGLSFGTIKELAYALRRAIGNYDNFNIDAIASRTLEFDETRFKDEFLKAFEKFLAES